MPRKLGVGVLFLLFGCIAMAQDFNGKWKADFSTERGAQKYVFDFHVDGTKLTGKVISDRHGETEIRDGKVDGNNVTFTEIVRANGQEVKISYTGKINGNEIRFSRQFGEFHTEELTAERVKEPVHP